MAAISPNQYDLTGENVTVSYTTSGLSGKPQLTYKRGRTSLSFIGDEITSLDTEIGTLVTVSIAKTVDRGFTSFSVVLPAIQLATNGKQSFRSFGITTVHTTSISGPVKGAMQTYKAIGLRGSATVVKS